MRQTAWRLFELMMYTSAGKHRYSYGKGQTVKEFRQNFFTAEYTTKVRNQSKRIV